MPYYLNEKDGWSMNIKDLRQRVDTARSQGLAVGQGTSTSCAGHNRTAVLSFTAAVPSEWSCRPDALLGA